jgi:hypothetical protein
MWLEGLGQFKNPMTSLGIEPNLLACSVVPQPNLLLHAPKIAVHSVTLKIFVGNELRN